jgi:dienelactone hydrolase
MTPGDSISRSMVTSLLAVRGRRCKALPMKSFSKCLLAVALLAGTVRAEWIALPWPALGATLPIWKPDDFDASKKYPAIVFYHGAGGAPSAEFIHSMTGGKDFVLVGMTYREGADRNQEIADGMGFLNGIKKTLVGSLSVDPGRIYVGGFSKGGWHSAMLLDRDRSLAGGLILGGGLAEKRTAAPKFTGGTPIYIGCGRFDGNYPPSLGALVYFRKLGATTTLEVWPGLTHELPKSPPEGMRQWLRIEASLSAAKVEAEEWIAERLPEIEAIADPVDRWFAYEVFLTLPFVGKFGSDAVATAKERIAILLQDPKVAVEKKWRDESRSILARESADRLLKTMQAALRSHQMLSEKAVGTRAGREAIGDVGRTTKLLETAQVVKLPGKPAPKPITTELQPGAPSTNPDRSPFFPPGVKVKPAK